MAHSSTSPPSGTVGVVATKGKQLADLWAHSRPGRTFQRYGATRGALLCGGIAYSALFSIFAALAIVFTVFSRVLGSNSELEDDVVAQINEFIPGLITTDTTSGIVSIDDLILSGSLWPTLLSAGVLLWTAISFMTALRRGVRAQFGLSEVGQSFVMSKVWSLVGFVGLGIGVGLSTAVSVVAVQLGEWLTQDLLSLGDAGSFLVTAGGLLASLVIDTVVVVGVVVVVAGARPRGRDLWIGAVVAGVAFGALRALGTSVVAGGADKNALLASVAVVVTLLLLVNFVSRVLLLVAAWMADPAYVEPHPEPVETLRERVDREREIRAGQGYGYPWSPLVRGVRRGLRPRPRRLVRRGEALRPETRPGEYH
ncbi:membrane protein [Paraoerskovia marina]|uniref:Membrane protein n=1 Tax=Paraoerskovia marina TaxID=545619 RepID=A0A1H1ULZ1_9CELL|nr:YihY/virulence factor BrkB family protein [Paraoerskovia marina]SDS73483.1 membrane protein [Paraoerskovia marina]